MVTVAVTPGRPTRHVPWKGEGQLKVGTMPDDEWRHFDINEGYDIKRCGDNSWLIRDHEGIVTELTDEEFNQLRSSGVNPQGLR